jgi:hypothetical protein
MIQRESIQGDPVMAERVHALIQCFDALISGFSAYVEGLTDAQWNTLVPKEGRTAGVLAHHIAGSTVPIAQACAALANGQDFSLTKQMLDGFNAHHAAEHAGATKAETLALLKSNALAATAVIRSLADSQLDNTGAVALFGGQQVSAQTLAQSAWIDHISDHWNSIKSTLGT